MITTAAFDATSGRYSRIISVVDPTINVRLDPNMKSPQTNQMGISVDRELAKYTSVTISYVRKDGSDFIGWTDTGGIYGPDTRTLADGRIVPVFVLANGTAARRFLLTKATATRAFGISARGDIVGTYSVVANRVHGFVATRAPRED